MIYDWEMMTVTEDDGTKREMRYGGVIAPEMPARLFDATGLEHVLPVVRADTVTGEVWIQMWDRDGRLLIDEDKVLTRKILVPAPLLIKFESTPNPPRHKDIRIVHRTRPSDAEFFREIL